MFDKINSFLFLLFIFSSFSLCVSTIYAQNTKPPASENTSPRNNDEPSSASCADAVFAFFKKWPDNNTTLVHSATVTPDYPKQNSSQAVVTYYTRRKKPDAAETVGAALSNLKNASNKLPYLNAINQKFYKDKSGDPTSQKIDAVLKDENYNIYLAKLVVFSIYFESYDSSGENKEVMDLFTRYLNGGDYFSERLKLEIDRQKNLISEGSYRLRLTEILKRYTDKIELTDSDRDPIKISALIMIFCAERDRAEKELSALEALVAIAKDVMPFIFTIIMSRRTLKLAKSNLELAVQNHKLAERKEKREIKEAKKNFIVEPNEKEVSFYSRK